MSSGTGARPHRRSIVRIFFSFGLVFYEMLGGKRAFTADSAVEVMNAILTADPPDLPPPRASPPLVQIVDHCVRRKKSGGPFSIRPRSWLSASRSMTAPTHGVARSGPFRPSLQKRIATTTRCSRSPRPSPPPAAGASDRARPDARGATAALHPADVSARIYFPSARFAADSKNIVYSAAWNGDPFEIFSTQYAGQRIRALSSMSRRARIFHLELRATWPSALEPQMPPSPPHGLVSDAGAEVPLARRRPAIRLA